MRKLAYANDHQIYKITKWEFRFVSLNWSVKETCFNFDNVLWGGLRFTRWSRFHQVLSAIFRALAKMRNKKKVHYFSEYLKSLPFARLVDDDGREKKIYRIADTQLWIIKSFFFKLKLSSLLSLLSLHSEVRKEGGKIIKINFDILTLSCSSTTRHKKVTTNNNKEISAEKLSTWKII